MLVWIGVVQKLEVLAQLVSVLLGLASASAAFQSAPQLAGELALAAAASGTGAFGYGRLAALLTKRLKRTPPKLVVSASEVEIGKLRVQVDSLNGVPYEFQWLVCLPNNTVVGAIPLEWTKVIPTWRRRRVFQHGHYHEGKVSAVSELEVRFSYRSLSFAEEPRPKLEGKMVAGVEPLLTPPKTSTS